MGLADPVKLVETLCKLDAEQEWLEFKKGHFEPNILGEYISALANSAMLYDRQHAYMIFGVEDQTHQIVGTDVRLKTQKVHGEVLEHWLSRFLSPKVNLLFDSCTIGGKHVEIVRIEPAYERPVKFINVAYIRVSSVKRRLEDFHEKERTLWNLTSRYSFEEGIAASHLTKEDIFERFHCQKLASKIYSGDLSDENIFYNFVQDKFIIDDMQGGYDVTNLFAISAAKNLHEFKTISHKAHRIIVYETPNNQVGLDDIIGRTGYVLAFQPILAYIMKHVTGKEIFVHGVRKKEEFYPEIAIREFLANVLIHQDLSSLTGRPLIEIFSDKIRFTNPGKPLIALDRFIDAPARSRNEKLAGMMRRAKLCEDRGSGVDRAIWALEEASLAPPLFAEVEGSTVVTIFRNKGFNTMSKEDRIRACYQHASIKFIQGDPMSNGSLRARLGLNKNQSSQASNVIKDAQDANQIRPLDVDQGNRVARYVPYWA